MNENSFTYQGVIVYYNDTQKAIVLADQNLITSLISQKTAKQNEFDVWENRAQNAISERNNCNSLSNLPPNKYRDACISKWDAAWDEARNIQNQITGQIATLDGQIVAAKAKLNNDIITIQNDIKLQIQTQLANTAAATQAASNQVGINQNQPGVLINQAQVNGAAQLLNLQNQAAADKLKQDTVIKVAIFFFITVILLGGAYIVFKKVS